MRYRKQIFIRKYKQPTYEKKLLFAVCEPVKPQDRRPMAEKCFNLTPYPPKPDHPYDVLLAKDMTDELANSGLVCLFHQNEITTPEKKLLSNAYQHEGMAMRYYNKDIVRICVEGTKYAPILNLATQYFFTVLFAPDISKIPKIIRLAKKYPQVALMGGMVDGRRLLTLKQLEELAKMPDLDTQRAILCHTLNTAQQGLLQSLNHHSSQLSQLLSTHANPPSDQAVGGEGEKE